MRFLSMLIAGVAVVVQASANSITWELSGVTFDDGSTASGSFVFDADSNTYSSIDVVTTTAFTGGGTYSFVCVATCTGLSPGTSDASQVLFLQSSANDLSGTPGVALFFANPLTNLGGSVAIESGLEALCSLSTCGPPSESPTASVISGSVVATPEPSIWMTVAVAMLGVVGWRKSIRGRRSAHVP